MGASRTKNTAKTFVFGLLNNLINIAFPFATRTIIIYKLGAEYVGLSGLFTSVLQILNVTELGFSSAVSFCLYGPIAQKDEETICGLVNLLKKLYKIIGVVILCAGLAILPGISGFISGEYPASINIYVLYLIYLANTVVSYLGFAYKGVLFEAYQEGAINYKISSIVNAGKYIVQIVVLLWFANYYLYALALPVASLIITILTGKISEKKHPEIVPKGTVPKEIKQVIKQKVFFLSAHSIAATLTNSIDNIVISGSLGLISTAIYGNYFYIFSAVTNIVIIIYRALKPAIGNMLCVESEETKVQVFGITQFVASWVTMWCTVCMACLYQPFISLWVGEQYLVGSLTLVMICLYFYGNSMKSSISGTFIDAAGLWNKTLPRQVVVALLNLVLDVLLVKSYGLAGIVFASFFATTIIGLPMDLRVVFKYTLNKNVFTGIRMIGKNAVRDFFICCVTYLLCSQVLLAGWYGILVKFFICLLIPNVIMIAMKHNTPEFQYVKKHILGMLKQ